jgi:hypothetical protein
MSERGNGIVIILIALAVIFACGWAMSQPCFWGPASCAAASGAVSTSPTQPIEMIQPQGFPARDQQNSQTNINNATAEQIRAQAAVLYAQANALEITAPAEAAVLYAEASRLDAEARKLDAEACAIRLDCGLQNYQAGEKSASSNDGWLVLGGFVGAIVVVVLILKAVTR